MAAELRLVFDMDRCHVARPSNNYKKCCRVKEVTLGSYLNLFKVDTRLLRTAGTFVIVAKVGKSFAKDSRCHHLNGTAAADS